MTDIIGQKEDRRAPVTDLRLLTGLIVATLAWWAFWIVGVLIVAGAFR